ncbi:MAG: membrane protein insertion efficiency factor YidD [Burkholderiales bacterium]
MARVIILILGLYRYAISPLLGSNCRFHPSCSAYASEALTRYGFLKGGWLAMKRTSRCHPWHPGGFDPLP